MPYIGKKPADVISRAVDLETGTFSGEVVAGSLDISGNIDVDGTTNLDAVDIDGAVDLASTVTLASGQELRFVDTNESIQSDGSKMIIKSGGTTFNLPTADGSANEALVTDGSGTLSFAAAGASLSNGSSNRVVIATGASTMSGEEDFTHNGQQVTLNRPGGTGTIMAFKASGTQVGKITVFTSNATSYVTSSDYRLKENINYTFDATTRLKQLKPCRFNFIADETNTLMDGFLAHEVSSIVPEAIVGEKDAVDSDGNIDAQGIDHSKLVPLLVKTIQELEERIASLESK